MLRQRFDETGGGFSEMTDAESIEISRIIIDRYVDPRASFHGGEQ
jgi:hypothetical protein